ncbi:MAG TPA: hypothetical protein VF006_08295 [Longimicrobium sp.]
MRCSRRWKPTRPGWTQLVDDVFWETWMSAERTGSESKVLQVLLRVVRSRRRRRRRRA